MEPVVGSDPTAVTYTALNFPRTARIICDGTVFIKNERPPETTAWTEVDALTAASLFLRADDVSVQKNR